MNEEIAKRLEKWRDIAERCELAYGFELKRMDEREKQYRGDGRLRKMVHQDNASVAQHVRNLTAEMIESQVDSAIPQPKVTPKRPQDAKKAKLIEDMLRAELDRMPFEAFNDLLERTVPIQGSGFFYLEWDSEARTHTTVGELRVMPLHPRQVLPQVGVYTGISDMDYCILRIPQTKQALERKYGVEILNAETDDKMHEEVLTQYIAFYQDEEGRIGRFSWVNDTILEDLPDYQARRRKICQACQAETNMFERDCPICGSKSLKEAVQETERVTRFAKENLDESAINTPIEFDAPIYRPNLYPLIMQKNVTVFGSFLGDSDADKIRDQQNTANRIETKIIDKLLKSGSYITLPPDADIEVSPEDMKVIRLGSPAGKQMMGVYDMQGNVSQDTAYLEQVYQEARQIIGITDSFQGRRDSTATSGRAKEFSAAQSAGRLESKRVMKSAAYAALFEAMFKFKLAYTDEARLVPSHDEMGNPDFQVFDRLDFLEQDACGEWYWNDQFSFSCDTTAPLAANREAMWQETNQNFQNGAFGNPNELETLILYWRKMEMLHYPGAGETRAFFEDKQLKQSAASTELNISSDIQDSSVGQVFNGISSLNEG